MANEPIKITIETIVNAPIEKVWAYWTTPEHVMQWNAASEDWHTIKSENDLQVGGKFSSRMEAKDGSFGFDFWGIYTAITTNEWISYTLGDDRKVSISFTQQNDGIQVVEAFDAETQNPVELQQMGWQSILNNFKKYTETN